MGSGSDSDDSDVALSAYAQVISSQGEILPVLLHPDKVPSDAIFRQL